MLSPIPADAIFSVSEFLDFTNEIFKPLRVTIQGEITDVTVRGSAVYFTLTDKQEKAVLPCMVWKNKLWSFGVDLKIGLEIQVVGTPNIYKPFGKFSFQADYISPVGEGALKQALEKLKRELEEAGYFAVEAKQPLPEYPKRIGLITSTGGDAIKDFTTHLGKYGYQIFHYDVRVEGLKAVDSLIEAFEWFNQHPLDLDVLVVTRGGGSLESLQAFNSEPVAKAIFASRIPVVSAIGHENDVTIADLVADYRASTPTDAGKILSTAWSRLEQNLLYVQNQIITQAQHCVLGYSTQLYQYQDSFLNMFRHHWQRQWQNWRHWQNNLLSTIPRLRSQFTQVERQYIFSQEKWRQSWLRQREYLLYLVKHLPLSFEQNCRQRRQYLDSLDRELIAVDPQHKLKQGYSIVTRGGQVIKTTQAVSLGEEVQIRLYHGQLKAKIAGKDEHGFRQEER
jgi:exodeoxyribonuclease VII large subunit